MKKRTEYYILPEAGPTRYHFRNLVIPAQSVPVTLLQSKARAHVWKRPTGSCCLARLLTVVGKVSFESSETGLFTSISANETEVHAILRAEAS